MAELGELAFRGRGYVIVGQFFKRRVFGHVSKAAGAGGAVALLADNDFGFGFARVVIAFVVHCVPVKKENDVGVLFNGPGFAQIGELWPLVGAVFQAAVEL